MLQVPDKVIGITLFNGLYHRVITSAASNMNWIQCSVGMHGWVLLPYEPRVNCFKCLVR